MKNLTKYLLLLLISLGTILFFVFSAEKTVAQTGCKQDYTSCVNAYNSCNQKCYALNQKNFPSDTDYTKAYSACGDVCANNNNICNRGVDNAYYQCLASPTTALTPTPAPNINDCSNAIGICRFDSCLAGETLKSSPECQSVDKRLVCCIAPTPIPAPKLVWKKIAICLAPTPTVASTKAPTPAPPTSVSTPTPTQTAPPDSSTSDLCSSHDNCAACLNDQTNSCKWNGISCKRSTFTNTCPAGEANWLWPNCQTNQCSRTVAPPASTSPPTPTLNPTLTPNCPINDPNVFCSAASPGPTCGLLYSVQTANCPLPNQCWRCAPTPAPVSQCVASDCGLCAVGSSCQQVAGTSTKQCACQSSTPTLAPTPTAAPTATPVPTPLPGSVQLALSVAQQGLTSTPLNISRQATVILKGTDGQTTTKTGTVTYSGGTFNGTINLGILPNGTYKTKVKVGNFLKSFTADLVISGTAANAQTKVIAGLDDQDDVDAILFYNGLRACFGSSIGVKKCDNPQDIDLTGDGNVDIIDYQTYLKGIRNLVQGLPVL